MKTHYLTEHDRRARRRGTKLFAALIIAAAVALFARIAYGQDVQLTFGLSSNEVWNTVSGYDVAATPTTNAPTETNSFIGRVPAGTGSFILPPRVPDGYIQLRTALVNGTNSDWVYLRYDQQAVNLTRPVIPPGSLRFRIITTITLTNIVR